MRMHARQLEGDKHEHEREHVAQVVARIGQERQRVLPESYAGFDTHEEQVQKDAEDVEPDLVRLIAVCEGGWGVVVMMLMVWCHVSYYIIINVDVRNLFVPLLP